MNTENMKQPTGINNNANKYKILASRMPECIETQCIAVTLQ